MSAVLRRIVVPGGAVASSKSVYRVDLETRRPVQLRKWLELSDPTPWTWDIDYPKACPPDIYALGVPADAPIERRNDEE